MVSVLQLLVIGVILIGLSVLLLVTTSQSFVGGALFGAGIMLIMFVFISALETEKPGLLKKKFWDFIWQIIVSIAIIIIVSYLLIPLGILPI